MDVQMPVMDGLTATRAIRALGGKAETIPIIGLSAGAFADEVQQCLNTGMNDHAAKPISAAELKLVVDRLAKLLTSAHNSHARPEPPEKGLWRVSRRGAETMHRGPPMSKPSCATRMPRRGRNCAPRPPDRTFRSVR